MPFFLQGLIRSLYCWLMMVVFTDTKVLLTEELYGESFQLSKPGLDSASHGADGYDFGNDDGSLWGSSDEESNRASLDREWERRREQFHAIGYRDGIIAGKEAAAQEGFNIGFKRSILAGYKFGLVRGISSAQAFLPDDLREKLTDERETKEKFQKLHESVHTLSTEDAAKLFYGALTKKEAKEEVGEVGSHSTIAGPLQSYVVELSYLLNKSAKLELRLAPERQLVP
ncbi:PREDICTED: uncharacterized protein LOC104826719 [Tarenaya hassleriana]|uniref:uncharacterized protein LOC104826719 n=1 Tax=Tarenaya hassleriana TaxID=28532 RepID=UPI00053CA276|nr:PREDICTED: uncharacterized protein LOC104826719 [Tarenaya hassleriana]